MTYRRLLERPGIVREGVSLQIAGMTHDTDVANCLVMQHAQTLLMMSSK